MFSVGPADAVEAPEPLPHFWGILAHFGIPPERVVLVREPVQVDRLAVPVQAERLGGRGPTPQHLDRLDALAARHGPPGAPMGCLFVTRAGMFDGRLLAEPYLAGALERAGVTVMHPQQLNVAAQLDLYRRARRIVFSEGSALHALQLLGRIAAEVAVLVRRPGQRLSRQALAPRVTGLHYWDRSRGLLHGLNGRGRPQWDRALTLVDPVDLFRWFAGFGIDLAGAWDSRDYHAAVSADLAAWVGYIRLLNLHPGVRPTIARRLRALRLELDLDAAWPAVAVPGIAAAESVSVP